MVYILIRHCWSEKNSCIFYRLPQLFLNNFLTKVRFGKMDIEKKTGSEKENYMENLKDPVDLYFYT